MNDPQRYIGAIVQYGCSDCGICDNFDEDFTSDISRIKSDSCSHFSLKFIYNLEGDSYKYSLSFTCNNCGENQLINVFDKITEESPNIHYKCVKCGKGSMKIGFLLKINEKIKIYKTKGNDENINKPYRTADGNDEDNSQKNDLNNFIKDINKDINKELNQPNLVVGGGVQIRSYETPYDNEKSNMRNNNFINNNMNIINKDVIGNNYDNNKGNNNNNFNNIINNNVNFIMNYNMTYNINNVNNQGYSKMNMNHQMNHNINFNDQRSPNFNLNNQINSNINNQGYPNYNINNLINQNINNNQINPNNNMLFNNINNMRNPMNINNISNNNVKINITFYCINDKNKKFKFIATSQDIFKDVITKMLNENSEYIEIEDIKSFLFKGKSCNMKKTLAEIGIKDGDEIAIVINDD
jgi:DNA-directed RNA polymerase subunit M/transcription elongation factor TFIIS